MKNFIIDKKGKLLRYEKNSEINVIIPEIVTKIGINAFRFYLGNITLHGGITSIGYQAFRGSGIEGSVMLSEDLKYIAPESFFQCKKITEIIIPSKKIRSIEGIAYENPLLKTIDLSESKIKTIIDFNPRYCPNLKNIMFPNTLEVLSDVSFCSNTLLPKIGTSIEILESAKNIIKGLDLSTISTYHALRLATQMVMTSYKKPMCMYIEIPSLIPMIGQFGSKYVNNPFFFTDDRKFLDKVMEKELNLLP